jgi:hypothetical protein
LINGDISNQTPPRLVVTIDVVAEKVEADKKLFRKVKYKVNWRKENLKYLWDISYKYGLSLELAGVESDGWTNEALESLMNKLDNRGANPFNYYQLYEDLQELIDELPYKANFKGVVSETPARFGSWGIDLLNL